VDVLEPVAYHDNGGLEAEDHIVDLLIRLQVDICGGLDRGRAGEDARE